MIALGPGRATRPPISNVLVTSARLQFLRPWGKTMVAGGVWPRGQWRKVYTRTARAGEHDEVRDVTLLGGRRVAALIRVLPHK
jgi:hypothetical protein